MKISIDIPVVCPHCGSKLEIRLYDAKLGYNTSIAKCDEINESKESTGWCGKEFLMSVEFSFSAKAAAAKIPDLEMKEVPYGKV